LCKHEMNTSTAALRGVEDDEKGTRNVGV
jgi:hypothetical protein